MGYQRKTCCICGSREDVIDGFCEECEKDYTYCTICKKMIHEDDAMRHRHMWLTDGGLWIGVGGPNMNERHQEKIKESLFALLTLTGIAEALDLTIQRNQMGYEAIHFQGSIFGYDSVWCALLDPKRPDKRFRSGYDILFCGDRFTPHPVDPDQVEEITPAVLWLIGLDNRRTKPANQLTRDWIAAWVAQQNQVEVL